MPLRGSEATESLLHIAALQVGRLQHLVIPLDQVDVDRHPAGGLIGRSAAYLPLHPLQGSLHLAQRLLTAADGHLIQVTFRPRATNRLRLHQRGETNGGEIGTQHRLCPLHVHRFVLIGADAEIGAVHRQGGMEIGLLQFLVVEPGNLTNQLDECLGELLPLLAANGDVFLLALAAVSYLIHNVAHRAGRRLLEAVGVFHREEVRLSYQGGESGILLVGQRPLDHLRLMLVRILVHVIIVFLQAVMPVAAKIQHHLVVVHALHAVIERERFRLFLAACQAEY